METTPTTENAPKRRGRKPGTKNAVGTEKRAYKRRAATDEFEATLKRILKLHRSLKAA